MKVFRYHSHGGYNSKRKVKKEFSNYSLYERRTLRRDMEDGSSHLKTIRDMNEVASFYLIIDQIVHLESIQLIGSFVVDLLNLKL